MRRLEKSHRHEKRRRSVTAAFKCSQSVWERWTAPPAYQLKRIDPFKLRPSRARVGFPKNGEVITPLKLWKLTLLSRF